MAPPDKKPFKAPTPPDETDQRDSPPEVQPEDEDQDPAASTNWKTQPIIKTK